MEEVSPLHRLPVNERLRTINWPLALLAGGVGALLMHFWMIWFTGRGIGGVLGEVAGPLLGWAVHFAVSIAYALVFAVLYALVPRLSKLGWFLLLGAAFTAVAALGMPPLLDVLGGGGPPVAVQLTATAHAADVVPSTGIPPVVTSFIDHLVFMLGVLLVYQPRHPVSVVP